MKVTIFNDKYNDYIVFNIDELTEEIRQGILDKVHSMGWKDDDCYSQIEE